MRPVIGIVGNSYIVNDTYPVQAAGVMNITSVSRVMQATPLIIPALADQVAVEDILQVCDGILLTGGRPNVHPREYGHPETEAHGPFDPDRDRLTLPLARVCIERGLPIMGLCRGFQEINVAMGGTLHPEIRDLPGRDNHRMPPDGTLEEKFALRHSVTLRQGGPFHKLFGSTQVLTNTLHGQGIIDAGERVVLDGFAPDGTPEALYIEDAPGFTLSVQWHPEWNSESDPVSLALFSAFAEAARDWKTRK